MKYFEEKDAELVKKDLDALKKPVKLIYFWEDSEECIYCNETKEVLSEIVSLSKQISIEIHQIEGENALAEQYKIDKTPATIITDEAGTDFGIVFYGIPSGYEFISLLGAIKMIGNNAPELKEEHIQKIKEIDKDIHLQVFVTPTCPYCPMAVQMGHKMAYLNKRIKADMVEASEFQDLSNSYNVYGVPKTIINETGEFEGSLPEKQFIDKIINSLTPKVSFKDKLRNLVVAEKK